MEIIAHRGYSGKYRENSKEAFKEAINAGINFIETDVQECVDGLIIYHNYYSPDINKRINNLRVKEAKELYSIITLEELLTICKNIKVLLDLKQPGNNPNFIEKIISIVLKSNHPNIIIASFNEYHVKYLYNYTARSFKIGLITSSTSIDYYKNKPFKLDCLIICSQQVTKNLIQEIGIPVYTFTVNDTREYKHLVELGVAGIITDYPVEIVL